MSDSPTLVVIDLIYRGLLRLYPNHYHTEFAEEMREVFAQAACEAYQAGPAALGMLLLAELLGMPAALLKAHLGASVRAAYPDANIRLAPHEMSWRELLVAMVVFLLPALIILVNPGLKGAVDTPLAAGNSLVLLFLAVMVLAGLLRGIPLVSYPYLRLVFVIAGYLYTFQWIVTLVSPALVSNFTPGPWDRSTYLLLKVISNGMLWLMLFCLTLLVVALLALLNRFQPLINRSQHDWTIFSYILYGESVFALLFLFESYRFETRYALASLLCLAAGGWLYLRSAVEQKRILALVGGLTLAVWVAVLGIRISPAGLQSSLSAMLSLGNPGRGLATWMLLLWVVMVVALILPRLLARLPDKPRLPDGCLH